LGLKETGVKGGGKGRGGGYCVLILFINNSWSILIMVRNNLYVLDAEAYHFCNLNKNRKV
jgi:hypothetical protein